MMYIRHGGRRQKTVQLYYTNAGSLQHNTNAPKVVKASTDMKEKKFDLVSIPEAGVAWMKSASQLVKRQFQKISESIRMTHSHVELNKSGYQQGGTCGVAIGGITGCVIDQGSDEIG